ncbi:MAG: methylated-DNA--[protein]-cysteine S-methyltransferase [Sandaracinaceae bacterium]|nr:methylated-DNA--[protein]-cysteine S-methyltransferase [Sandaracinaceae bacterium]
MHVSFDAVRADATLGLSAVPSIYADPLKAYFFGEPTDFATVPLDLRGTDFQLSVWNALARIPYGAVRSYGAIANGIGSPRAMRAVGAASGANPIPVIIPCHRVIEASMRLGGFSAGLARKRKLLALEGVHIDRDIVHPGQLSLI